jgi:chromosome segregation ATPase
MNIKEVKQLLNQQTEKVNQLKQELKTAEKEQARLFDLEKELNQDCQNTTQAKKIYVDQNRKKIDNPFTPVPTKRITF